MTTNAFLLSWDMTGLEAVVDVTQDLILGDRWEKEKLFDIIKDPDNVPINVHARNVSQIITTMRMRAIDTLRNLPVAEKRCVYKIKN